MATTALSPLYYLYCIPSLLFSFVRTLALALGPGMDGREDQGYIYLSMGVF